MDNHIISILQNFEKPDAGFLQDKECLICLESLDDLESNIFVQLPCKCSNSVYHIDCILKLLHSGENKNFCPHCKTNYDIPLQQQQQQQQQLRPLLRSRSMSQIVPYIVINTDREEVHNIYVKNFTHILMFHILINSIMNIINIVVSRNFPDYNGHEELQVLMIFYFGKLFFNYCILMYARNNIDKIEDCLVYSYVYQTILLCFLIYVLTLMKNDSNSTILIANNVSFCFGDSVFRVIVEYKMRNAVNVV
jgi:hypothetical protein